MLARGEDASLSGDIKDERLEGVRKQMADRFHGKDCRRNRVVVFLAESESKTPWRKFAPAITLPF